MISLIRLIQNSFLFLANDSFDSAKTRVSRKAGSQEQKSDQHAAVKNEFAFVQRSEDEEEVTPATSQRRSEKTAVYHEAPGKVHTSSQFSATASFSSL